MHHLKDKFYRLYWLVALALFIGVTCYWAILTKTILKTETVISLITFVSAILTFVFFVQKQKLEETRLFYDLFKDFNKRYKYINKELQALISDESKIPDKDLLITYFNLCAEEYLYYRRYYIFEEVWVAWTKGMAYYFRDFRVKDLWKEEEKTGSYYGFSLKQKEIEKALKEIEK